jgi:hypothetical protein
MDLFFQMDFCFQMDFQFPDGFSISRWIFHFQSSSAFLRTLAVAHRTSNISVDHSINMVQPWSVYGHHDGRDICFMLEGDMAWVGYLFILVKTWVGQVLSLVRAWVGKVFCLGQDLGGSDRSCYTSMLCLFLTL